MAETITSTVLLHSATEEMGRFWLKRGIAPIIIFGNVEDPRYVQLLKDGIVDKNNTHILEMHEDDKYKLIRNSNADDFGIASSIYENNNAVFTTYDNQVFDIRKEIDYQLELQKDNTHTR